MRLLGVQYLQGNSRIHYKLHLVHSLAITLIQTVNIDYFLNSDGIPQVAKIFSSFSQDYLEQGIEIDNVGGIYVLQLISGQSQIIKFSSGLSSIQWSSNLSFGAAQTYLTSIIFDTIAMNRLFIAGTLIDAMQIYQAFFITDLNGSLQVWKDY
ncbi:UNKNOWN [Stylonychia lemnae]|uniref:Uncharacterized protein n=1 Tax=Stylonychia lemnae TaxID=5949 RepID=A0A078AS14_STYLE|nr:UNKNOWN [Stylonychia lemnae]|eukprot:CDW83992.1 UNKNOWN [Stylonychia lemnae]